MPRLVSSNVAPPTPGINGPKRDGWITRIGKASTGIVCALAA